LLGLVGLAYLALALMYYQSSRIIDRQYGAETRTLLPSSRPEIVAEGERLARIYGCAGACHGKTLQGQVMARGPLLGRIVAPGLPAAVDRYSPSEFEAVVRQGVKPDGTSVIGMPSARYASMTDRDLAAILSYLRTLEPIPWRGEATRYGLGTRLRMVTGSLRPETELRSQSPWPPGVESGGVRFGEYLVQNACLECHDKQQQYLLGEVPDLEEAKRYDRGEFVRFLTRGTSPGPTAEGERHAEAERFSLLERDEIESLYSYLLVRR
jgi:mono/diheme cytochrome c family protein